MVTLKSNKNISGMEEITGFISYSQIKDGFLIIELNSSIGSFIIEVDLNTLKDNKDSLEVNLPDIQNTLSRMIEDKQPVKFKNGYLLPLKKME
ncbi:MAG: hypothetical protein PHG95_02405 [Patescibacteria group bacterium]|nr:hypothetical protein [Patescibacteria group bacterium]